MTVQEVVLKALSGEIHSFRAADILCMSARTLRRWRERYEQHGYLGLVDKRRQSPSVRRIAAPVVERVVRLYRERYRGFNVRHFHQIARREHGVTARSRWDWPVTRPRSFTVGIASACFKRAPILISALRDNAASFAWLV